MPQSVMYHTVSGEIRGSYRASSLGLLRKQQARQGWALLELETPLDAEALERYAVVDGVLTAKTEATITASRTPFPPDGVSSCTVTLDPFVPCTLRVNTQDYALTDEDQELVLTADVPTTFTIRLAWLVSHWAAPITVVSQTWIPVAVTDAVAVADGLNAWWSSLLTSLALDTVGMEDALSTPWTSIVTSAVQTPVVLDDALSTVQVVLSGLVVQETLGISATSATVRLPQVHVAVEDALRIEASGSVRRPVLDVLSTASLVVESLVPGVQLPLLPLAVLDAVSLSAALPVVPRLAAPVLPTEVLALTSTVTLLVPVLKSPTLAPLTLSSTGLVQAFLPPVAPAEAVTLVDPIRVQVQAPVYVWEVSVSEAVAIDEPAITVG